MSGLAPRAAAGRRPLGGAPVLPESDPAAGITLRQLRALLAIAETGSLRRAAVCLGVAQPSLSAQLQGLEEAIGCRLVDRGGRGATLTAAGREAERRARAILEAVGGLRAALADRGTGRLRLGAAATIAPYLLPAALADLAATGAGVAVREGTPADLVRGLAEGRHDAILAGLPLGAPGLAAEELFRERLMLVLPRAHPLAVRSGIGREDLAGLEVLGLAPEHRLAEPVAALCESFGARVHRGYEGASLDALRRMAGRGHGVAFLPELYVRSEVETDPDVVAREIHGRAVCRSIGLAWRAEAGPPPGLEALAAALGRAFRALVGR